MSKRKKAMKSAKRKRRNKLVAFAKQLESATVTIEVKAGEGGRLFGAVSTKQIAEALKKAKLNIDKT